MVRWRSPLPDGNAHLGRLRAARRGAWFAAAHRCLPATPSSAACGRHVVGHGSLALTVAFRQRPPRQHSRAASSDGSLRERAIADDQDQAVGEADAGDDGINHRVRSVGQPLQIAVDPSGVLCRALTDRYIVVGWQSVLTGSRSGRGSGWWRACLSWVAADRQGREDRAGRRAVTALGRAKGAFAAARPTGAVATRSRPTRNRQRAAAARSRRYPAIWAFAVKVPVALPVNARPTRASTTRTSRTAPAGRRTSFGGP